MCSCCCCCCSAALVVVVSATVCFIFYVFFIFFGFFLHFSSMSFPSLSSNSCAHKRTNFSMRIYTHISTRTHSHTHMHTHVRTLKDTWWEALSFTVCLFCFLLISFYVARSSPFGLQMPPKLQSNAVFISFALSLSSTLSPSSLSCLAKKL